MYLIYSFENMKIQEYYDGSNDNHNEAMNTQESNLLVFEDF